MMDEVTTRKIKFLKNDNFNQMNDYIETNQLQEKYGGTASNLIEFWLFI